jgi:hypothetical protein
VIWEPILASDWSRPTRPVLARISDRRTVQFWDKEHLVAKKIDAQLSKTQPTCCRHDGILWDVAALYPKGIKWGDSPPAFIDGAVKPIAAELGKQLSSMQQ